MNLFSPDDTLILTDLDRTIIDSDSKLTSDVINVFKKLGIEVSKKEVELTENWYDLVDSYDLNADDFSSELMKKISLWAEDIEKGNVAVYSDGELLLNTIHKYGYPLVALSRSLESITFEKLECLNISHFFNDIYNTPLDKKNYPDKLNEARLALKKYDLPKIIMVGDREGDDMMTLINLYNSLNTKNHEMLGFYVNRFKEDIKFLPKKIEIQYHSNLINSDYDEKEVFKNYMKRQSDLTIINSFDLRPLEYLLK